MTSSILNFQKPRKMSLTNICQIICAKFHQNRHNRLGCRADTDRHTHTQTHRDTPSVSIATYSVKMTEYKNKNAKALRVHSVILLLPSRPKKRYLTVLFWSNALNMHIFVFSASRSIRIDILFSDSRHFRF